ncbi:hypothetical protein FQZ97_1051170 [compost metagenome]
MHAPGSAAHAQSARQHALGGQAAIHAGHHGIADVVELSENLAFFSQREFVAHCQLCNGATVFVAHGQQFSG